MTNPMTPTEQDKELREKINSLFESVFSQGMRAGKDVAAETYEDFDAWHKKGETDEIMQLITADRKRVVLEVRERVIGEGNFVDVEILKKLYDKAYSNGYNDRGYENSYNSRDFRSAEDIAPIIAKIRGGHDKRLANLTKLEAEL